MKQETPEILNKKNCVMVYAMDVLGGKWRLPIMWKLYQNKTMRYNEVKRSMTGITNIEVMIGVLDITPDCLLEKMMTISLLQRN